MNMTTIPTSAASPTKNEISIPSKLRFAVGITAAALFSLGCTVPVPEYIEVVVERVPVATPTEPVAEPVVPELRWIREGEPHPAERVNIIMRDPDNWRERCQLNLHGEASRVPTNSVFPDAGTEPMNVCLHAAAE